MSAKGARVIHLERQTQPNLVQRTSRRRPSERAFEAFRRNIIERERQEDIAASMGICRGRVANLVRKVVRWAKKHDTSDALAIKVQHTAMLYELWRDARRQWKRSCEDATHHSIVSVEGLATAAGTPLPKKTTTRVSRKGQSGNPRYLEVCDTLLASIRGIWGADAPKQVGLSAGEGGQLALAVLLDASSRTIAPPASEAEPEPNVIDVDAELLKLEQSERPEAERGPGAE